MISKLLISIGEYFDGENGKKRRNVVLAISAFIIIILTFAFTAEEKTLFDSPEMQIIQSNGILHVGVRENVPGFCMNGEGLDIELATLLAETVFEGIDTSISLSIEPVSTYSAGAMLQDGSLDAVIAQLPATDSSNYAYSNPYYVDDIVVSLYEQSSLEPKDMTLGCIQDSEAESALRRLNVDKDNKTLMVYSKYASYSELFDALKRGDIEGAVVNRAIFRKYADEYNLFDNPKVISTVSYCIVVSNESTALAQLANLMLYNLKESGEYDALLQKYGL